MEKSPAFAVIAGVVSGVGISAERESSKSCYFCLDEFMSRILESLRPGNDLVEPRKGIGLRLLDAENNFGIGGLFGGCACWSPSAFVIHG